MAHLSARRRLRPDKRVWEPEEFLAELGSVLRAADRQRVQAVRLYGEPDRRTGERQHVAEVFTASDPVMRMRLYAAQEDLFERGDWFVVVRGEWLGSGLQADRARRLVTRRKTYDSMLRGEPVSIAPAALPGESCFRLALSSGQSVLLDLGSREDAVEATKEDAAVFISHAHPDHTGALRWALARRLPVFLSDATLRVLEAAGKLEGIPKADLGWLRPVAPEAVVEADGIAVRHHRVPHCIGSVAWSFCGDAASLFYTGDVMLRSGAYGFDWLPQLRSIVAGLRGRTTVLLEASRAHAVGTADDEVLWGDLTALPRDVIVVGQDNPERLLFAYVQAYAGVHRPRPDNSPLFVLTPGARRLLQACWQEIFHAGAAHPDVPFVKTRADKWGVAESHALHWLDHADLRAIASLNRQRLWFVDRKEVDLIPPLREAVVYDLRTGDGSPLRGLERHRVEPFRNRPAWTQHSHGADVAGAATAIQQLGAQVVLFHARTANYERFAARYGCDAELLKTRIRL